MRGVVWEDEFASIGLRDGRLNRRFYTIMEALSDQPLAPINQAHSNWHETKAAYRFFANEKVDISEILRCHQERSAQRLKKCPVILAIQDTTILDYNHHPGTTGLGNIMKCENARSYGLIMHTTMAITPEGSSLGILHQKIWARDKIGKRYDLKHKSQPIHLKESGKWIEGLRRTVELSPPTSKVVTVADRESDIYDLFDEAFELKTNLLLRLKYDRKLADLEQKLWPHMEKQKVKGRIDLEVTQSDGSTRTAEVSIRFKRVTLRPPHTSRSERKIRLFMIYVIEEIPPKNAEAVEWMLASTLPVPDLSDALEKIEWYKLRWTIEQWHRILKSGCRVEHCKLATAEKLKRYITMMSVVAWRILLLTRLSRTEPKKSCEQILASHEWKALYCKINKTNKIPSKPPTIGEATTWIARLGGYLARKNDGPPGPTVVWRGWQRMQDYADAFLLFQPF